MLQFMAFMLALDTFFIIYAASVWPVVLIKSKPICTILDLERLLFGSHSSLERTQMPFEERS